MTWNGKYFTAHELTCRCGCGGLPESLLVEKLDKVREECGFPLIVTSAYRCPDWNMQVSQTGRTGPHTLGLAADIKIYGFAGFRLMQIALDNKVQGIGFSQHGPHTNRFIHLDWIDDRAGFSRPNIWSYP